MHRDSTTVTATRQQVCADLSGEAVILNMKDGVYYSLSDVGARVWELVQEPTTVGALIDRVCAEYDVERERFRQDLQELLERLLEAGLVTVTPCED